MTRRRRAPGAAAGLLLLAACVPGVPVESTESSESSESSDPGEIVTILASYEVPVTVEGERAEVSIDVPPRLPELEAAAARESDRPLRLGLVFYGVESPRSSGYYDVYAGLPAGAVPDPRGPYHLGTLAPFGPAEGEGPVGAPVPAPSQVSYDLTGVVERLAAEGRWGSELLLSFVRRGLLAPEDAVGPIPAEPEEAEPIRIEMIRVVRRAG